MCGWLSFGVLTPQQRRVRQRLAIPREYLKEGSRRVRSHRVPCRRVRRRSSGTDLEDIQWRRVAESRSNIIRDSIFGRQVDLLEELWSDGNAASCSQSFQSRIGVVMIVVKVVSAIDGAAAGMVLFDIWHMVGSGHFAGIRREKCIARQT